MGRRALVSRTSQRLLHGWLDHAAFARGRRIPGIDFGRVPCEDWGHIMASSSRTFATSFVTLAGLTSFKDGKGDAIAVHAGWPFTTFSGHVSWTPDMRRTLDVGETHACFPAPSWLMPNELPGFDTRPIPLRPRWRGVILNTLLYAAIILMIRHALVSVRAARRRRRGACPACGYALANLTRCPECGTSVDPASTSPDA